MQLTLAQDHAAVTDQNAAQLRRVAGNLRRGNVPISTALAALVANDPDNTLNDTLEGSLARCRPYVMDIGVGGEKIDNSLPQMLHASPLDPLANMLGPDGKRWGLKSGEHAPREATPGFGTLLHEGFAAARQPTIALA